MIERTVYLSPLPEANRAFEKKIVKIINRAGMSVIEPNSNNVPVLDLIKDADIILGIITPELLEQEAVLNRMNILNEYEDILSKKAVIVWCPKDVIKIIKEKEDYDTLDRIKKLIANQHFISYSSPIKLVDDLRNFKLKKNVHSSGKQFDITFIGNENDRTRAEESLLLINDIFRINPLYINYSEGLDYEAICSISILNSELCVVFSKNATEWAVHFSQQIWKLIGGASSKIPILVVFDKKTVSETEVLLDVPNVYTLFTEDALVGLEIKMFYEKNVVKQI